MLYIQSGSINNSKRDNCYAIGLRTREESVLTSDSEKPKRVPIKVTPMSVAVDPCELSELDLVEDLSEESSGQTTPKKIELHAIFKELNALKRRVGKLQNQLRDKLPSCPENVYKMKLAEDFKQPDIRNLQIDSLHLDQQLVEFGNVHRATEQGIQILRDSIRQDLQVSNNIKVKLGILEANQYQLEKKQQLCLVHYRTIKLIKMTVKSSEVLVGASELDDMVVMQAALQHLVMWKNHQELERRSRVILCYLYNGAAFLLNCIRIRILEKTGQHSSVEESRVIQRFMRNYKSRRFSSMSFNIFPA
ncbi:hypothetical protein KR067_000505 [Drosophila pandora]|nr:hypothetical protein KR067_000505 [Drosophila pandora]